MGLVYSAILCFNIFLDNTLIYRNISNITIEIFLTKNSYFFLATGLSSSFSFFLFLFYTLLIIDLSYNKRPHIGSY